MAAGMSEGRRVTQQKGKDFYNYYLTNMSLISALEKWVHFGFVKRWRGWRGRGEGRKEGE